MKTVRHENISVNDDYLTRTNSKPKAKRSPLHTLLRIVALLLMLGLLYWIFFIKIPSQVSYAEVWSTIKSLTLFENLLLTIGGLLTIVAVGWTAATVLPGISIRKATKASVVGQLTSVVLPPPLDLVIRFSMYRSYSFSNDKSAIAVGVAGIARYFTVFTLPIIGLAAVVLSGQGKSSYVWWLLGLSALVLFALWLMKNILESKKFVNKLGRIIQSFVNFFVRLFRHTPDEKMAEKVEDFSKRTGTVAIDNFWPIAISNIVWGFSCFAVLFMAMRFSGIDTATASAAQIFLITAAMLFFNAFPITPGGIGVTEVILTSLIVFPTPADQTAFTAALFIYRVYTWLLPMPVGVAAFLSWQRNLKKHSSKPVS